MPNVARRSLVNFNLLKPQGGGEKIYANLFKWLLSTGRYIIVFVEAWVLIVFVARFKLDADLASLKEQIEQRIPYIESLKQDELQIRKTQLQLSAAKNIIQSSPDYSVIFDRIAKQTPRGVRVTNINLESKTGSADFKIVAQTPSNSELSNFIFGLKEDGSFQNVSLSHISLDQGVINFTLTGTTSVSKGSQQS